MLEFVITMLWIGGYIPAYRAARNNGYMVFNSAINGLIWPADVGWHLAMKYCQDDKS